jgi:hypothetical protein
MEPWLVGHGGARYGSNYDAATGEGTGFTFDDYRRRRCSIAVGPAVYRDRTRGGGCSGRHATGPSWDLSARAT